MYIKNKQVSGVFSRSFRSELGGHRYLSAFATEHDYSYILVSISPSVHCLVNCPSLISVPKCMWYSNVHLYFESSISHVRTQFEMKSLFQM